MRGTMLGMYALVPDCFTPVECEEMIERAERAGFEEATIYDKNGDPVLRSDYRNNDRFVFEDAELADLMWSRLQEQCGTIKDGGATWKPCGVNERFRVYRYHPEQYFGMHTDHPFVRSVGEMSFITVLVNLNESYTGGETTFLSLPVGPRKGQAILFEHHLLHEGTPVETGVKYMLRTDVMYRRVD